MTVAETRQAQAPAQPRRASDQCAQSLADTRTIGYLTAEFPSQTHVWVWREVVHMRELGRRVELFATRRPPEEVRARHAFAEEAQRQTVYLWPQPWLKLAGVLLWALLTRPVGLCRTVRLALTIDVKQRPRWRTVLPLVLPACVLARQTAARSVDHLHVHSCANAAILALMLKRLNGTPYSLTLNANIEWWGGAMAQKFSEAEFVIVITQWLLDQVRRDFPQLREDQALLGRIGVDTRKWTPAARADDADDVFRIVTVGRLHESKAHDVLLRAVRRLVDDGRRVELDVIGAGPQRAALEALVAELDLNDRVRFRGTLSEDQIIDAMNRADAFVLVSHAEPLGVVYMEAMAMEVPTIGTDAGGVPEIITDGADGLLVPPRDPDGLAERIALLMDDPPLRHRLGEAGRRTIIDRFDSRLGARTLHDRLTARDCSLGGVH